MSQTEHEEKAIQQREQGNIIAQAQLYVLRTMFAAVAVGVVSGIWVIVADHFALQILIKQASEIAGNVQSFIVSQTDISRRLSSAEAKLPTPQSRWTFGMTSDLVNQFHDQNPTMKIPDVERIHEIHSRDIPQ